MGNSDPRPSAKSAVQGELPGSMNTLWDQEPEEWVRGGTRPSGSAPIREIRGQRTSAKSAVQGEQGTTERSAPLTSTAGRWLEPDGCGNPKAAQTRTAAPQNPSQPRARADVGARPRPKPGQTPRPVQSKPSRQPVTTRPCSVLEHKLCLCVSSCCIMVSTSIILVIDPSRDTGSSRNGQSASGATKNGGARLGRRSEPGIGNRRNREHPEPGSLGTLDPGGRGSPATDCNFTTLAMQTQAGARRIMGFIKTENNVTCCLSSCYGLRP
jgi:hypothetical protein